MFFVFFMFSKEHDCSCSWYPTNPSKRESKTKTGATNLRLNRSNPCEKKKKNWSIHQTHTKPKLNQTHQMDQPINTYETKTKSNPLNGSTHQMKIKPKPNRTDQPIYQQNQIKPIKRTNPSNANQTKTKSNRSTHLSLWISEGGGHYHDGGGAWWRRRPSLWIFCFQWLK